MNDAEGKEPIIRIATLEDAEQTLDIYAPYVLKTAVTFEWEVPSLEEFRARMARTLERYPFIVAESDGQLVGFTYAGSLRSRKAYDWTIETAIYVKEDTRRGGVGRKLYEALEAILKLQGILSANACIAYAETESERLTKDSLRFHERMGYSVIGEFHDCGYKFDTWYSVLWMEKMLGPHTSDAPEPRAFSELSESELIRNALGNI